MKTKTSNTSRRRGTPGTRNIVVTITRSHDYNAREIHKWMKQHKKTIAPIAATCTVVNGKTTLILK